jgi:hypothetical protein
MHEPWKPARRWVFAKRFGLWGALAAALLWPLTMAYGVTLSFPGGFIFAANGGSLNTSIQTPASPTYPPGISFYDNAGAMWLLPSLFRHSWMSGGTTTSCTDLIMPFWILALASGFVSAVGARRCRPPRIGLCEVCDYDLKGIPTADRCPECGTELRKMGREGQEGLAPPSSEE